MQLYGFRPYGYQVIKIWCAYGFSLLVQHFWSLWRNSLLLAHCGLGSWWLIYSIKASWYIYLTLYNWIFASSMSRTFVTFIMGVKERKWMVFYDCFVEHLPLNFFLLVTLQFLGKWTGMLITLSRLAGKEPLVLVTIVGMFFLSPPPRVESNVNCFMLEWNVDYGNKKWDPLGKLWVDMQ